MSISWAFTAIAATYLLVSSCAGGLKQEYTIRTGMQRSEFRHLKTYAHSVSITDGVYRVHWLTVRPGGFSNGRQRLPDGMCVYHPLSEQDIIPVCGSLFQVRGVRLLDAPNGEFRLGKITAKQTKQLGLSLIEGDSICIPFGGKVSLHDVYLKAEWQNTDGRKATCRLSIGDRASKSVQRGDLIEIRGYEHIVKRVVKPNVTKRLLGWVEVTMFSKDDVVIRSDKWMRFSNDIELRIEIDDNRAGSGFVIERNATLNTSTRHQVAPEKTLTLKSGKRLSVRLIGIPARQDRPVSVALGVGIAILEPAARKSSPN